MSSSHPSDNPYISSNVQQLLADISLRGTVYDSSSSGGGYNSSNRGVSTHSDGSYSLSSPYQDFGSRESRFYEGGALGRTSLRHALFTDVEPQLCDCSAFRNREYASVPFGSHFLELQPQRAGTFFQGFSFQIYRRQEFVEPGSQRGFFRTSPFLQSFVRHPHAFGTSQSYFGPSYSSHAAPIVQEPDDDTLLDQDTDNDEQCNGPVITEVFEDDTEEPFIAATSNETSTFMTDHNVKEQYKEDFHYDTDEKAVNNNNSQTFHTDRRMKKNKNSTVTMAKTLKSISGQTEERDMMATDETSKSPSAETGEGHTMPMDETPSSTQDQTRERHPVTMDETSNPPSEKTGERHMMTMDETFKPPPTKTGERQMMTMDETFKSPPVQTRERQMMTIDEAYKSPAQKGESLSMTMDEIPSSISEQTMQRQTIAGVQIAEEIDKKGNKYVDTEEFKIRDEIDKMGKFEASKSMKDEMMIGHIAESGNNSQNIISVERKSRSEKAVHKRPPMNKNAMCKQSSMYKKHENEQLLQMTASITSMHPDANETYEEVDNCNANTEDSSCRTKNEDQDGMQIDITDPDCKQTYDTDPDVKQKLIAEPPRTINEHTITDLENLNDFESQFFTHEYLGEWDNQSLKANVVAGDNDHEVKICSVGNAQGEEHDAESRESSRNVNVPKLDVDRSSPLEDMVKEGNKCSTLNNSNQEKNNEIENDLAGADTTQKNPQFAGLVQDSNTYVQSNCSAAASTADIGNIQVSDIANENNSHVDAIDIVAACQQLPVNHINDDGSEGNVKRTGLNAGDERQCLISMEESLHKMGYRRFCSEFVLEDNRLADNNDDVEVNNDDVIDDESVRGLKLATLKHKEPGRIMSNSHISPARPGAHAGQMRSSSQIHQVPQKPLRQSFPNTSSRKVVSTGPKQGEEAQLADLSSFDGKGMKEFQEKCPHNEGFYESHGHCCPKHTVFLICCNLCDKNMDKPLEQQMEDMITNRLVKQPTKMSIKGTSEAGKTNKNSYRNADQEMAWKSNTEQGSSPFDAASLPVGPEPPNKTYDGYSKDMKETAKRLQQLVAAEGLEVKDVYPDGNCLFTAIVDQLRVRGQFYYTPRSLREAAIQQLRTHPKQEDGTHLEAFLTDFDGSWEEYLIRMSRDGEWGDHMVLSAISTLLRRRIVILRGGTRLHRTYVTPSSESAGDPTAQQGAQEESLGSDAKAVLGRVSSASSNVCTDLAPPAGAADDQEDLYIGHIAQAHYVSLRRNDWRTTLHNILTQTEKPCFHIGGTSSDNGAVWRPLRHLSFLYACILLEKQFWTRETFNTRTPSDVNMNRCKAIADHTEALYVQGFNQVRSDRDRPQINIDYVTCDTYVHFKNTNESMSNVGDKDLVADLLNVPAGFLRLVPKLPKAWYRHVIYEHGTPYLKHIHDRRSFAGACQFQCNWPPSATEWGFRLRPNNWPDANTVQQVVSLGCTVAFPRMDTVKSEHIWCFDFSDAEQLISDVSLTPEQRQCFHVFKLLLDELCPLNYKLLKHLFFYACEKLNAETWNKLGEVVDFLVGQTEECLEKNFWPNYFIHEQNLLDSLPVADIETLCRTLKLIKQHPLEMICFFLSENVFVAYSLLPLFDNMMDGLQRFSDSSDSIQYCFVPAFTKLIKQKLLRKHINEAVTCVEMAQTLFGSITGQEEEFSSSNMVQHVFQEDLELETRWMFIFMADQQMLTQNLETVCRNLECISLSDLFGNTITEFVHCFESAPVPVSLTKMPKLGHLVTDIMKFYFEGTCIPTRKRAVCLLYFLTTIRFSEDFFTYTLEVLEFPALVSFSTVSLSFILLKIQTLIPECVTFTDVVTILDQVSSLAGTNQVQEAGVRLGLAKTQLEDKLSALQRADLMLSN